VDKLVGSGEDNGLLSLKKASPETGFAPEEEKVAAAPEPPRKEKNRPMDEGYGTYGSSLEEPCCSREDRGGDGSMSALPLWRLFRTVPSS
jgi:hypothetical protein